MNAVAKTRSRRANDSDGKKTGPNVKYMKPLAHPGRDHRVSVKFCKFSNYRQPQSEWVSCGTTPNLESEVKHETHHISEFFDFNASKMTFCLLWRNKTI